MRSPAFRAIPPRLQPTAEPTRQDMEPNSSAKQAAREGKMPLSVPGYCRVTATRGTSRGTAHLRNRCNDGHYRHLTLASAQVVRPQHWAGLLLTHWFRVRPPGAPPAKTRFRKSRSWTDFGIQTYCHVTASRLTGTSEPGTPRRASADAPDRVPADRVYGAVAGPVIVAAWGCWGI